MIEMLKSIRDQLFHIIIFLFSNLRFDAIHFFLLLSAILAHIFCIEIQV